MIEEWAHRAYSRWRERLPRAAKLFLPTLTFILATVLVWPGALLEIADGSEKWWVALLSWLVVFGFLYWVGHDAIMPVRVPNKPKVHYFIPANDLETVGDALLQYAGFLAAENKYGDILEFKAHDSSGADWIDTELIKQCIEQTPDHEPIWVIIAMSSKGTEARQRLNVLLERSYQLRKQLTVLFTVTSSQFTTSDRNNYFRVFVDGCQEAVAIASYIQLVHAAVDSKKILCVRNSSNYGKDAANVLEERLKDAFSVHVSSVDKLVSVDTSDFGVAVVIAYDEDLRTFFTKLKDDGFTGVAIGTTTLSVPDWQARIDFPKNVKVLHTAVDHDDADFARRLAAINVDTIAARENCIISTDTLQQLRNNPKRYDAYKTINYNYISAFCEDCVRLFAVSAKYGKPSVRALLDDPKHDDERRDTIIKDVDFGVTGDAHVNIVLKARDKPGNEHSALVVVDLQNDFFERGALVVQGLTALLPGMNAAISGAVEAGWPMFFTRDLHPEKHVSFKAQGGPWPVHCVKGSIGAEFHSGLVVPDNAIIISKGEGIEGMGYSPFENDEFERILKQRGITRLVVAGVALEYCVKATCMDARTRGLGVVAVKDLIASVSQDESVIREHWDELKSAGAAAVSDFKCAAEHAAGDIKSA